MRKVEDLEGMGSSTGPQVEARNMDLDKEVFPGGVCIEGSGNLGKPYRTARGWDEDLVLQGSGRVDPMEAVADDVDGFLHEFLYLANGSDENRSAIIGADSDDIVVTDADLAWLQDPDVFMPSPMNLEAPPDAGDESCKNVSGPLKGSGGSVNEQSPEQPEESEPAVEGSPAMSPQPPSPPPSPDYGGMEETGADSSNDVDVSPTCKTRGTSCSRDAVRREKVRRYLEKKKRRKWLRVASYKSRQRVANERPRLKGRFLPLESEFIPIAELQRRQRALVKQHQLQQASQAVDTVHTTVGAAAGMASGFAV